MCNLEETYGNKDDMKLIGRLLGNNKVTRGKQEWHRECNLGAYIVHYACMNKTPFCLLKMFHQIVPT